MSSDERTVLVVCSDRLFRESASAYLERHGWGVLPAADELQALVTISRAVPAAVLVLEGVDRRRPAALVRQIHRRWPLVSVTVLGITPVDGAEVLLRTATGPEVLEALERTAGPSAHPASEPDGLDREGITLLRTLTQRERRILSYLVDGLTKAEIAERLGVSENTVRTHQQNLHRKLGVHSRLELMRLASGHGLLRSKDLDRVV
ncbi:MAG: response regulator transcription factor [Actinobacteria bacterium]|nr:response regulator transcription factor [Actinomycetota bacterium]